MARKEVKTEEEAKALEESGARLISKRRWDTGATLWLYELPGPLEEETPEESAAEEEADEEEEDDPEGEVSPERVVTTARSSRSTKKRRR